jgi:hypothetical protein
VAELDAAMGVGWGKPRGHSLAPSRPTLAHV